ncbi:hypothetical protein A2642_02420 [Candidatus Nomurabacteria bacterium RIFCSPHIGHO2_01_FULL_39_10]|uniref:Uncharacterized protein n=1 Tax=Candidatus Nomurabacteria bacterium RIFCSPHIGHO2_01_FULL_39_10 TaxID=1801733 RepID=A0A1F6V5P3_9BACT|nr:MAG: hypothetical protein A2642_02420 [Candidatus Nomurabacteria bacterium RIFCSPHIGHO2_01_FULL_39_10]
MPHLLCEAHHFTKPQSRGTNISIFRNSSPPLKRGDFLLKSYLNYREQSFFNALPKDAKTLYIHQSHRSPHDNTIQKIEQLYGKENILHTIAPSHSGQSFTDYYPEIEQQKADKLNNPLQKFLTEKTLDAIIYLCDFVCDGYQSPIFPEDVVTSYHISHAIHKAQQQQKPLIVGYRNNFCFTVNCPEREYITNPQEMKIPTNTIQI